MTQTQLGKYRIIEKIGQGGFGDVYKAEDTTLGSTVALKLLAPHYMRDPDVVQRFRREARAAARLRHPNIVHIYDLAEDQGTLFLAMDHLPGLTLAQILQKEGSLPLPEVVSILTQVADALDYAHQQGLVHRDVKPGNIMVDDVGRVTLMDFGLVKAADNTRWSLMQVTGSTEPTTGGAMMGTPQYMAPEQAEPNAEAATIGPWTDIYSLGVVVYQMVTGRVPFEATTPLAVLRGHVDKEPRPPSQLADMPRDVEAAILKALAKPPENRWPTAGAFAQAVASAAGEAEEAVRREKQLRELYQQAQQAIAEQKWVQALALCGQIMSLDANFRGVGALFDKANAGMRRQREWEAQQAELAALYDRAMAHMAAGEWDEAIAVLEKAETTSDPYVFRDTPKKLAQAREARERALAGRREQLATLRERVLALVAEALERLAEVQALEPAYPGLKRTTALLQDARREWEPEWGRSQEEILPPPRRPKPSLEKTPERSARTTAWWLLGVSILLGLPTLGASTMGIVGAVAMLKGRSWGRKVGLAFSILLEVAGLVAAGIGVGNFYSSPPVRYFDSSYWYWWVCAWALASMSIGIALACLLSRESVVRGLGQEPRRAAGMWPIAMSMMLTGLGAVPTVGLLRNRNWGRIGMMVFLCIFALASSFFTVVVATECGFGRNREVSALVIIEEGVVLIWCAVAFFYLRRPQVKRWFRS